MKLKNDRPEQLDREKDIFLQQILIFFLLILATN